jgi:dihydrofolate reductase
MWHSPTRNGVGGLSIASQLSARGLMDEYHFVIHPFVVGKGPRLFDLAKPRERVSLELVGSNTFGSGVVALHYRKRE